MFATGGDLVTDDVTIISAEALEIGISKLASHFQQQIDVLSVPAFPDIVGAQLKQYLHVQFKIWNQFGMITQEVLQVLPDLLNPTHVLVFFPPLINDLRFCLADLGAFLRHLSARSPLRFRVLRGFIPFLVFFFLFFVLIQVVYVVIAEVFIRFLFIQCILVKISFFFSLSRCLKLPPLLFFQARSSLLLLFGETTLLVLLTTSTRAGRIAG